MALLSLAALPPVVRLLNCVSQPFLYPLLGMALIRRFIYI